MTTMTHSALRWSDAGRHSVTRAVQVVLFWAAAAVVVATVQATIDPVSPLGGAVVRVAALLAAAYAYTRFCARQAGITHALGVGIAWLVLAIVAEIAVTAHFGRAWYALLGSPDRPLLRNVFLFIWIFAPAVFAQREDNGQ